MIFVFDVVHKFALFMDGLRFVCFLTNDLAYSYNSKDFRI